MAGTADRVVEAFGGRVPGPGLLSAAKLAGDPSGYQTNLVHAESDGSFSIVIMVCLPGQQTPIHDHLTWCCTAVLQGTEYEEVYASRGDLLEVVRRNANPVGTVSGFAPPGDIHRVTNIGDSVAVSMHVYGTDISRVGSSVRRATNSRSASLPRPGPTRRPPSANHHPSRICAGHGPLLQITARSGRRRTIVDRCLHPGVHNGPPSSELRPCARLPRG